MRKRTPNNKHEANESRAVVISLFNHKTQKKEKNSYGNQAKPNLFHAKSHIIS